METIQFNGQDYRSLATIADANTALAPSEFAEQWAAESDDNKSRRLITATRLVRSYREWVDLTGEEAGVKLAVSRLAIAQEKPEQNLAQISAGSANIRFRRMTDLERLDALAVRLLNTATAASVGGGFGASDLPEVPQSSFTRYSGQETA